jgi:hypothetical protein
MTTPETPPEDTTAAKLREAQEAEYGTYVAKERIVIDGALAFNEGDPVPVSHVKRGVVTSSQVDKKKG